MEYEKKLSQLKDELEKAKNMKIRAETKMEQLTKQKEDIISQIESFGIQPSEMEDEINRLKNQIEELLLKADALVPRDILKNS